MPARWFREIRGFKECGVAWLGAWIVVLVNWKCFEENSKRWFRALAISFSRCEETFAWWILPV